MDFKKEYFFILILLYFITPDWNKILQYNDDIYLEIQLKYNLYCVLIVLQYLKWVFSETKKLTLLLDRLYNKSLQLG